MSISALRSTSGIPALADRTIADTILQKTQPPKVVGNLPVCLWTQSGQGDVADELILEGGVQTPSKIDPFVRL